MEFNRYENDGIVKIDKSHKIWHSVTFTIIENEAVVARMITNNWKTFTNSIDNKHLSIKAKYSFWKQLHRFQIYANDREDIVDIKLKIMRCINCLLQSLTKLILKI